MACSISTTILLPDEASALAAFVQALTVEDCARVAEPGRAWLTWHAILKFQMHLAGDVPTRNSTRPPVRPKPAGGHEVTVSDVRLAGERVMVHAQNLIMDDEARADLRMAARAIWSISLDWPSDRVINIAWED
jgi:hypothetical protein